MVEDNVASSLIRLCNRPSEVLCKQNVLLLVATERVNTITNSSRVGVGSSPAGRWARLYKLDAPE